MIYAILSDIHGNLEALESVIEDAKKENVDEYICLGDIVGYCSDPNECISTVQENCVVTVIGNHDLAVLDSSQGRNFNFHAKAALEWTIKNLNEDSVGFLKSIPFRVNKDSLCIVHSSPRDPETWRYITNMDEALDAFRFFEQTACFIGHTHFPIVVTENGELIDKPETVFQKNNRYLVNVGSVGQPRDGNPHASYVLYDAKTGDYQNRRVKYDVDLTQKKMRKAKLPEYLIHRLSLGR